MIPVQRCSEYIQFPVQGYSRTLLSPRHQITSPYPPWKRMGSHIPNASRNITIGRLPKNFTWLAYASGPLMAVAFETRMCSIRKAPTGTIPLRECRRRRRKEWPSPALRGGTPPGMAAGAVDDGAAVDGVVAIGKASLPVRTNF